MKQSQIMALMIIVLLLKMEISYSTKFTKFVIRNDDKKCVENVFAQLISQFKNKEEKVNLPDSPDLKPLENQLKKIVDELDELMAKSKDLKKIKEEQGRKIASDKIVSRKKEILAEGVRSLGSFLTRYPKLLPEQLEKEINSKVEISHSYYNKKRVKASTNFLRKFYKLMFKFHTENEISKTKNKGKINKDIKKKLIESLKLSKEQISNLENNFLEHKQILKRNGLTSNNSIMNSVANNSSPIPIVNNQKLNITPSVSLPANGMINNQLSISAPTPSPSKVISYNSNSTPKDEIKGLKICNNCKTIDEIWEALKLKIDERIKIKAKEYLEKNEKKIEEDIKKAIQKDQKKDEKKVDEMLFNNFVKEELYKKEEVKKEVTPSNPSKPADSSAKKIENSKPAATPSPISKADSKVDVKPSPSVAPVKPVAKDEVKPASSVTPVKSDSNKADVKSSPSPAKEEKPVAITEEKPKLKMYNPCEDTKRIGELILKFFKKTF